MNNLNIKEILLLHHSHFDIGYTHSQPILWELQNEYIDQVIDWLEATEDLPEGSRPKWTCEATEPVIRWLHLTNHSRLHRFKALHKKGRLGVSALRWHTTALANRKGLERLLNGKDMLEQLLETKIQVACQHDVTGVSWPLADVLLDADVDLFVMAINIHLGRAPKPRPGMFLWEAPSGRKIRVFNGNHYTMFDQLLYAWDDSVDRMAKGWAEFSGNLEKQKYPHDFVYLTTTCSPVMWDNAPPNPFLPSLVQRWNEARNGPPIRYATFDDLRLRAAQTPDSQLPTIRGDWTDFWSIGGGSSPVATACNQRTKPLIEAADLILGSPGADENYSLDMAKRKVDLYDEHTYGYYDSDHTHPMAQATEAMKQALAYEGHEYAALALMDGLESLARNPKADKGLKGILLCNTGPDPLTIRPELPEAWLNMSDPATERTYRASRMFYNGRSWGSRFPGGKTRLFGPVTLPPFSWKTLPFVDLPRPESQILVGHEIEVERIERREVNFAPAAKHERRVGKITTPFHIMRYDPESGRILSLTDRKQEREVLSPRLGIDLFSFVRERTDALVEDRRYAFYQRDLNREKIDESCWQDWSPVHEYATRVIRCVVSEGPGRITLTRDIEAPGMIHLSQSFTLSAYDPVIQIDVAMELTPDPSPQAIFFAVPLAMKAGWTAAYDTAGAIVEADRDQVPGACRNFITSDNFSAMWDEEGGIGLLAPEAPMVQFGAFHFGPPIDVLPRPENPLILSWPVNNYWDTNVPRVQYGRINLRFGILSFGKITPVELQQKARRFRQAQIIWPVTTGGRSRDEGSFH
jgi:alpha-mannosidase